MPTFVFVSEILNRFEQDGGFPADIFLTLTQEGTLKVKPV
jgi:hypothetical protein